MFMEGLKGFDKTFWGTLKKWEKKLTQFLFEHNFQKSRDVKGQARADTKTLKDILRKKVIRTFFAFSIGSCIPDGGIAPAVQNQISIIL